MIFFISFFCTCFLFLYIRNLRHSYHVVYFTCNKYCTIIVTVRILKFFISPTIFFLFFFFNFSCSFALLLFFYTSTFIHLSIVCFINFQHFFLLVMLFLYTVPSYSSSFIYLPYLLQKFFLLLQFSF